MSESSNAAADAALADVLTDADTGPGSEVDKASEADLPACTRDEAEQLVSRARAAISELDAAMTDIIRRQAWLALGYETPQKFWLTEFGRTDERPGGFSRAHLYRTARVLGVLYGLYERLGDDALAINISERALREIPRNDGDADVELLDAIGNRVEQLGDDYTPDDIQQAVNEEISAARDRLNNTSPAEMSTDDLADQLESFGFDASQLRGGDNTGGDGGGGGDLGDDDLDDDPTEQENPPQPAAPDGEGVELTQMESGLGSGPLHVANIRRSIVLLCEAGDELDDVMSLMTAAELAELSDSAEAAIKVLESIRNHDDDRPMEVDLDAL